MSFRDIFEKLKPMLVEYAEGMVIVADTDDIYSLDTRHIMKNGKPLFFASVIINKSYVSFHLMPVYVLPDLLEDMSASLKKRMHGKSCFNFTSVDEEIVSELKTLTRKGFERFKAADYA